MALFKLGSKKKSNKNVKAGVGSKLKKLSKPKLAFLSLAALLLLTSTGYGGFVYYKQNELKDAKAAGWRYLYYQPNIVGIKWARACKVYRPNTGYGNLWEVNLQVYRNGTNFSSIGISIIRNGSYAGSVTQNQWLYGVVAGTRINTSKDLGDQVQLKAYAQRYGWINFSLSGSYSSYQFSPASLPDC